MSPIAPRRICVFCAARPGDDPAYREEAVAVGERIGRGGHMLIYGGGDVGLMGALAAAADQHGALVLGILPRLLARRERHRTVYGRCEWVETLAERKRRMFEECDAVLALPGGLGTLDELFEAVTLRQLGLAHFPIVLLDTRGYWQPLRTMLASMGDAAFTDGNPLGRWLTVAETLDDAFAQLTSSS